MGEPRWRDGCKACTESAASLQTQRSHGSISHSMFSTRRIAVALGVLLSVPVVAQDQPPPVQRSGPRRPARGAEGTREFLGFGPAPDEAAAKKGEPIYQQNCGTCHGASGRGAQGPNLVRSVSVLHDEKGEEIGPVIKNGRPQAGMPAFPESLEGRHLQHLAVPETAGGTGRESRDLRHAHTATCESKPAAMRRKGEEFFNGAGGCKNCHSVTGDLAKIGSASRRRR